MAKTPPKETQWVRNGPLQLGSFSTIFLCTNLDNNKKFVAKTVMAHDLEQRTAIEVERRLFKAPQPIDYHYFPKYLGFNIEKQCKEMGNVDVCNLFLEWVPRGSILQMMERQEEPLKEGVCAVFCRDMLKALVYLHGQGKVHGDIKASNVLLGMENLKLCDLGSGKIVADGDVLLPPKRGWDPLRKRVYTTGSDGWRAPEVVDEIEQGPPSDIYSLGCTLVEMATGDPPQKVPRIFFAENPKDIDPETGHRRATIDLPCEFSDASHKFMEECLAEHPKDRPTAAKLLDHPWFKSIPLVYPVPKLGTRRQVTKVESSSSSCRFRRRQCRPLVPVYNPL
ncbi:hypothetical protein Mapa_002626 [Marchantia paleacea]|nr:hypothetical protein Mapa_002626 [Marchantia paleacea]